MLASLAVALAVFAGLRGEAFFVADFVAVSSFLAFVVESSLSAALSVGASVAASVVAAAWAGWSPEIRRSGPLGSRPPSAPLPACWSWSLSLVVSTALDRGITALTVARDLQGLIPTMILLRIVCNSDFPAVASTRC